MIIVVLHEPQDLVNIAHVVRAMKNFGFRDLRLVRPREYDAFRGEGIAHQTQDILARVTQHERLEDALADCVHVVGFTSRGRDRKSTRLNSSHGYISYAVFCLKKKKAIPRAEKGYHNRVHTTLPRNRALHQPLEDDQITDWRHLLEQCRDKR